MSTQDTTRTHFHTVLLGDFVGHALATVYGTIKSWNEERQTRRILSNLSDSELNDIGLSRHEIDKVARGL